MRSGKQKWANRLFAALQVHCFYISLYQSLIILIQYTMNQENLRKLLKELSSSNLANLQTHQMREWLLKLQQQSHQIMAQQPKSTLEKTRTIRKFLSKGALKNYISNRIGATVKRTLARVLPKLAASDAASHTHNCTLSGGKSKFKKRTRKPINLKLIRFRSNLKDALTRASHQELNCPICLETMISPALTLCGHVFCWECIDQSLLFLPTCPNCRENIKFTEPIVCAVLDKIIKAKVFLNEADVPHFEQRLAKHQSWRQNRVLDYDKLRIGTLVDVRDTESIWCQGTIVKIYRKFNTKTNSTVPVSLLMHYNRWNKLYNEIIDLPSSRLAPLNCFSGRVDIPRYNLSEENDNMRGSVISGMTLRIQLPPHPDFEVQGLSDSDEILESDQQDSEEEENDEQQNEEDQISQHYQEESQRPDSVHSDERVQQFHHARLGTLLGFLNHYQREGIQLTIRHNVWPEERRPQQPQSQPQPQSSSPQQESFPQPQSEGQAAREVDSHPEPVQISQNQGQSEDVRLHDQSYFNFSDQNHQSIQRLDNSASNAVVQNWGEITPLRFPELHLCKDDNQRKESEAAEDKPSRY